MLALARYRAKRDGIPFDLSAADFEIPDVCPVLGIELQRGRGRATPQSPSLDRLRPELGYLPGNVVVVSNRVNVLKRDATLEEMEAMAEFYARHLTPTRTRRRKR